MLKVGITGGIGSGKTLICTVFRELNIPVYSSDERAKNLMVSSPALVNEIKQLIGEKAYVNNTLNKQYIASIIFRNKEMLNALNNIVHPEVEKDFDQWYEKQHSHPYVLKEAAILFESGSYKKMDKNILVVAPEELRIKWVKERDNISEEKVRERINNQWKTERLIKLADFIIDNSGNKLILPQIIEIDKKLRK